MPPPPPPGEEDPLTEKSVKRSVKVKSNISAEESSSDPEKSKAE